MKKFNKKFLQIACCYLLICLFSSFGITNAYSDESFQLLDQISTNSWSIGLSTSENELFVADGINNNILIFDFYGKTIRNFSLDDDNDCTGHIHGITVSKNRIYVVKENNDCVAIYDLSGKLLEKFGSKGKGMGEFNSPQNIEVFDNRIYVTDNKNKRIQIFDLEGNFLNLFNIQKNGLENGMETPYDLEIYQKQIYVTLPKENKIQVYDLEGNFLNSLDTADDFRDPLGISIRNDRIFVASGDDNQILVLNLKGDLMDKINSGFLDPHQIVLFENKMYVLDTRNFLVKIFSIPEIDDYNKFENESKNFQQYQIYLVIFIPIIIAIFFLIKKFYINQRN